MNRLFSILGYSYNERTIRRMYDIDYPLDVLFVGSSHTSSGIVPEVFDKYGVSIYNLSVAKAGPIFYHILLRSFFKHNPAPKIIALEASYQSFTTLHDTWPARYFIHLKETLKEYPSKKDYLVDRGRSIFKTDCLTRQIDLYEHNDGKWDRGYIKTDNDAYRRDIAFRYREDEAYFKSGLKDLPLIGGKFYKAELIVKDVASNGINVILYDPPEYYVCKSQQTYRRLYHDKMSAIVEGLNYRVEWQNFNYDRYDEFCWDAANFRNPDHMNHKGAIKFSEMFYEKLLKRFNERRA